MKPVTSEAAFESVIEDALLQRGYECGDNAKFDRELVLNPADVLAFLRGTQERAWKELGKIHGAEVEKKFLFRLARELDARGMLDCLRNGVVDYGVRFHLCHFAPVSSLNPETAAVHSGPRRERFAIPIQETGACSFLGGHGRSLDDDAGGGPGDGVPAVQPGPQHGCR